MLEGADDQNFVIVAAAIEEAADFEALCEERRLKDARRPRILVVSGVVCGGGGGEMLHGVYEVQTLIRAASGDLLLSGRPIL